MSQTLQFQIGYFDIKFQFYYQSEKIMRTIFCHFFFIFGLYFFKHIYYWGLHAKFLNPQCQNEKNSSRLKFWFLHTVSFLWAGMVCRSIPSYILKCLYECVRFRLFDQQYILHKLNSVVGHTRHLVLLSIQKNNANMVCSQPKQRRLRFGTYHAGYCGPMVTDIFQCTSGQ